MNKQTLLLRMNQNSDNKLEISTGEGTAQGWLASNLQRRLKLSTNLAEWLSTAIIILGTAGVTNFGLGWF